MCSNFGEELKIGGVSRVELPLTCIVQSCRNRCVDVTTMIFDALLIL